MRLVKFHPHIISCLFILLEVGLAVYLFIRLFAKDGERKSWAPVSVLLLLLIYNAMMGWFTDLFLVVFVNTISLMVVTFLMLFSFLRPRKRRSDSVDSSINNTDEAFAQKCFALQLSLREIQVADLVVKGYGNQRIAEELHISKRTVEGHIQNIFDKVGCERTRLALITKLNE